MRIFLCAALVGWSLLLSSPASGSAPFPVNQSTADYQVGSSLAPLPGGGFVAAWTSGAIYTSQERDIYVRRFDPSGAPLDDERRVNLPGGSHTSAVVASDSAGNFAVAWNAYDTVRGRIGIYARAYDVSGDTLSGETLLAAGPHYVGAALFRRNTGDCVLVWSERHDSTTIWSRAFDANLSASRAATVVAGVPGTVSLPISAAPFSTDRFVAVWLYPGAGQNRDVRARVFGDDGVAAGPEVIVNTTAGLNSDPDVAVRPGGFSVVWWSGIAYPPDRIELRHFDSNGAAGGLEVRIDDGLGGAATPAIASGAAGDLSVAWSVQYDLKSGVSAWQVRARRFDPTGAAASASFLVSDFHPDANGNGSLYPDALLAADGTAIFSWDEESDASVDVDIFARIVTPVSTGVTAAQPVLRLSCYPNPFNPNATVAYAVESAGRVHIAVYDVSGRRVKTLVDEVHRPGTYYTQWDGRDDAGLGLASGVYLCRIEAAGESVSRKMLLLK